MKRIIYLTLFLITTFFSSYPNRLKHISTHNGLSSERTFSIEKDTKGFMWISTRFGIDRYDGSNTKHYSLIDQTGANDLTGRINIVEKDKSGKIWAYTSFGQIFVYDELSDSFRLKINLAGKFSDPLLLNGILFPRPDTMVIFGSFGILIYNTKSGNILPVGYFSGTYIFTVEYFENHHFVVATDKGTYVGQIDTKSKWKHKNDINIHERVQCIYYEKFDSTLLLGTFSGKLFVYSMKKNSLEDLNFNFRTSIRTIKCYNNTIYIGTGGAGLVTINRYSRKKEETYESSTLSSLYLVSYSFYDLLFEENRLWLATSSDGVYLLDENIPDFRIIDSQPHDKRDKTNSLNTFLEDSEGNLWFGTNDGVLRYDVKRNSWIQLLKKNIRDDISRYNAIALCEDNEGNIWVGGPMSGLVSIINKKTLKINEKYYFEANLDMFIKGQIYSIFKDSEGNIWLGGLHGLLTRFNPRTGKIRRYNIKSVNTITEYSNTIMVGTVRGLYFVNKKDDSFVQALSIEKLQSALLAHINVIYQDKDGIIWLGSEGGLMHYNRSTNELKIFSKADGMNSKSVFGMLADKRNRLWISTEKELGYYDPTEENFTWFGIEEGLNDQRFSPRSQFQRQNGELLFGTSNGIVSFVPEKIDHLKIKSNLILTDFSVNYQSIHSSTHEHILDTSIYEATHLKLKYNQNTFSFGFTTINFTNPNRTKFEWMLKGYDTDWIKGIDAKNAYYTNIPPGTYKFIIRAINSNDDREIGRKTVVIDITPPLWGTVWAKIFYFLIFIGLSWLIIDFTKQRLEKRSNSEKIRFFTNTAHELKTPVSLIKAPLHKLQEKEKLSPEGETLLNLVVKNTNRLNNLVLQLLDFQKTEISNVKLYVCEKELTSYIREKLDVFKELVEEKNIKLSLILNTEAVNVWFDEEKMDKILNNLLSNAFKYTPKNGEIKVVVSQDKNNWVLEIRDNGIGIPEKLQKEVFKLFYRADNAVNSTETGSGIGLLLTKNLVKLQGGTIVLDSVEGVGTVFTVKFPLGMKHFSKNKTVFVERQSGSNMNANNNAKPADTRSDKKTSVLLVEDNDELRYFLSQCLVDKYIIHEAANGKEGVKLAKVVLPELIISDVMMPEMNGYELCKQIKENKETSHIPVILLTALDDKSNILKGYELGADNYISKPFDTNILLLTIDNTISTRQALRRNLMLPLEKGQENEPKLVTNEFDKVFLDEVISIIDKNILNSEFAINDLCCEMAMSRTSFYNKMKIITNQSPNEFIRLVRLNRAAKLLKDGYDSITEVASLTGFGDVKYFSTAFKKHFGVSPKKYGGIQIERQ